MDPCHFQRDIVAPLLGTGCSLQPGPLLSSAFSQWHPIPYCTPALPDGSWVPNVPLPPTLPDSCKSFCQNALECSSASSLIILLLTQCSVPYSQSKVQNLSFLKSFLLRQMRSKCYKLIIKDGSPWVTRCPPFDSLWNFQPPLAALWRRGYLLPTVPKGSLYYINPLWETCIYMNNSVLFWFLITNY